MSGGSAPGGPVALDEDRWHAQIAQNLTSVYLTCKHVLPVMEAQGQGAIVNTSSTSGLRWTGAAQVAYAAAKAGVIQLSRVVAAVCGQAIRVNTWPGQLDHTRLRRRIGDLGGSRPAQTRGRRGSRSRLDPAPPSPEARACTSDRHREVRAI